MTGTLLIREAESVQPGGKQVQGALIPMYKPDGTERKKREQHFPQKSPLIGEESMEMN